ncbi:sigma 54-interacting transcriptional regulator [Clostridiaceae bacterium M8S5]|nr:sigma 54-interacting transcriptional regulator [Clostridiaceae bacterium M8S5]
MGLNQINLNHTDISSIMSTSFLKIYSNNTSNIINKFVKEDINIAVIVDKKHDKDIPKAVLTAKDILKLTINKIPFEKYIKKWEKTNSFFCCVNSKMQTSDVINTISKFNPEYVLVYDDKKVIGILTQKEIQKLYDESLMYSYTLLNKIVDVVNDAVCVIDTEGIVRYWNGSAEIMHGIKKKDILNKPLHEVFPNALLPRVLKEQKTFENIYNEARESCFNIISARPLYKDGRLIGAISCDRDITEITNISRLLNQTKSNLEALKEELGNINKDKMTFDKIIGNNLGFKEKVRFSKKIAGANINILLMGESGTGKEVFAEAIHCESKRRGNFIPINCSAIPKDLLESELFGYEKGAFTGANKNGKIGKLELANNGTIFLDEIGDMPLEMQPKILRFLEDGIITRIGSEKSTKIDVRVIAATNKDIKEMVDKGGFRKDLFYRLNSITIELPPLRERKDDIPILVDNFVKKFCRQYNMLERNIPSHIMDILENYQWEGNIRELKNIVERIVILAKNNSIDISLLPEKITKDKDIKNKANKDDLNLNKILIKAEINALKKAMRISNNNKTKAAKLLKVPRSTLYFKLDKYRLE